MCFSRFAQLLCPAGRILAGGLRHDDDELLASVAADHIIGAEIGTKNIRQLLQQEVPCFVSVAVIELFEVIKIGKQHGEAQFLAAGPPQFAVECLLHEAAIEQPG